MIAGPVALFDGPRLAFDSTGKINIVWGRNNVWISQAQDGLGFGTAPIALMPPNTPIDTGGPRVAVTAAGHIFVAWTDELAKDNAKPGDGSFCTNETTDANGNVTNTFGGNFYVNETFPAATVGGPVNISFTNTRNLSNNDWKVANPINANEKKFSQGFFGCSYDNSSLFLDKPGLLHLLWSDDSPDEDVLTSETHGTDANGFTLFSFPINLASFSAASPQAAVDTNGTFYVTWSGGPTGGTNSEGIFYIRSDDAGSTFTSCAPGQPPCGAINIAPNGAISPAFPQIAVDSNSNVNIAWEQPTGTLKGDGTDMFNVFFARSTDKETFPTVLQVTTSPSTLCYEPPPPPEGSGSGLNTPDVSTCGTVQLGVDANSTPDTLWVNQPSGSAVADIDLATTNFPTGAVSPTTVNLSATSPAANVTITVSQGGFSGPITFSCFDVDTNSATLPSWLTCTFNPPTLNTAQSTTDTLTLTRTGTPTASMFMSAPSSHILPDSGRPTVWSMAFAALCLTGMVMLAMGRRRELSAAMLMRGFLVMTLTIVLAAGLVSCGGSTSTPSSTGTGGSSGSGGTGGTGGTGGSGGSGGSGGGTPVIVHVAVMAQTSGAAPMNLGTVTVTAQ
jgi:hypothetical protein